MRLLASALFLGTICILTACSPLSDTLDGAGTSIRGHVDAATRESTPENTAQEFLAAASTQDVEAFKEHLTLAAVQGLESGSAFDLKSGGVESYSVGTAEVNADSAQVPVDAVMNGQDQRLTLNMRLENNAWKVFAMAIAISDDSSMTVDFEKLGGMLESMVEEFGDSLQSSMQSAIQDSLQGGSEEQIAKAKSQFDAIQAITPSEFESGWLNTTDFRGALAADALLRLTAELGLAFDPRGQETALRQVVASDVTGLSRLESIERISAEADLHPIYPGVNESFGAGLGGAMVDALVDGLATAFDPETSAINFEGNAPEPEEEIPNAVTFQSGSRRWPATFAGPYLIAVNDLEENAPHATGGIRLSTKAYGVAEGVLSLNESTSEAIAISEVTDTHQRNLNADENVSYWGGGITSGAGFEETTGIDLKNLLRDVETVERLTGTRKLVLPTSVETIKFSTLAKNVSQLVGDIRLTVKKTGKHTSFDVTGPEDQLKELMIRFWPRDAKGADLGIIYQTLDYWSGEKAQASVQTQDAASTLEIKLISKSDLIEYPFELRAIPLEKFAQMPEKIDALAFEGHDAPVEVSFLAFKDRSDPDFPKVTLQAMNHSNKDALTVHATFVYLDRVGAELKDFPHTLQGTFTSDGFSMVVAQEKTEEVETTAFFMPVETDRLRATVEKIEFIDGTVWERES